jgi:tetratricopeptide (TPR) repeat protein
MAEVATFRGELADAVDLYIRAYDLSVGNGDFLDAAWDAVGAAAAFAYRDRPDDASRFADQAAAAAEQSRSPSALDLVAWIRGEIAAGDRPGQARRHLQQAVALATSAGSRFVGGLSRVSLATWTPGTERSRSRWPTMSAPSANGSRQAPGPRCG